MATPLSWALYEVLDDGHGDDETPIRLAHRGTIDAENCHPIAYDVARRRVWSHDWFGRIQSYDLRTKTLSNQSRRPRPQGRAGPTAGFYFDHRLCLCGYGGSSEHVPAFASVAIFDTNTWKWLYPRRDGGVEESDADDPDGEAPKKMPPIRFTFARGEENEHGAAGGDESDPNEEKPKGGQFAASNDSVVGVTWEPQTVSGNARRLRMFGSVWDPRTNVSSALPPLTVDLKSGRGRPVAQLVVW